MCLAFGTGRVPPAMTSGRAYRPALAQADVFAWLEQRAGTMFDPRCLEVLRQVIGPVPVSARPRHGSFLHRRDDNHEMARLDRRDEYVPDHPPWAPRSRSSPPAKRRTSDAP